MKSKYLVLSSVLMLALAGCNQPTDFTPTPGGDGGDGGDPVEPAVVHVESVSLDSAAWALKVGETFTLHETVLPANADNKNVTWSASGDGVVSVVDGLVTALKVGESTVTVTTVDGNKTDTCVVTVIEADPVGPVKPEGAVDLEYSTAATIGDHGDNYCYFNDPEWWSGASAKVNEAWKYEEKIVFDYTYDAASASNAQDWTVQLIRKNTSLTANTKYNLSFKLTSDKAGKIKVQAQEITIVKGENTISVDYTEGAIPGAAELSFSMVLPLQTIGSARLELENVKWEAALAAPEGVVVNQSGDDYIIAFAAVAGATGYKAYYVNTDGQDVANEEVTNGGKLTKVSTLAEGKYKVFVTTLVGEKESARSVSYGQITIGNPEAVVPAGGPKTQMEFGEEHNNGALALPDDKFVYWNDQGWCGSVVPTETVDAYTEEGTVHASYVVDNSKDFIPDWAAEWQTVPGCDYCFQIFYKNTSLTAGSQYTLSIKFNSLKAGQVKFNNVMKDVEAGADVTLSVDYTEVANDASFALVLPSSMGSNTIVISEISWVAK